MDVFVVVASRDYSRMKGLLASKLCYFACTLHRRRTVRVRYWWLCMKMWSAFYA